MLSVSRALDSIAGAASVTAIVLGAYLLLRLHTANAAYWKRIGSPKLLRWLWGARYDELDDSITLGIARILKVLIVLFFTSALFSMLLHYLGRP